MLSALPEKERKTSGQGQGKRQQRQTFIPTNQASNTRNDAQALSAYARPDSGGSSQDANSRQSTLRYSDVPLHIPAADMVDLDDSSSDSFDDVEFGHLYAQDDDSSDEEEEESSSGEEEIEYEEERGSHSQHSVAPLPLGQLMDDHNEYQNDPNLPPEAEVDGFDDSSSSDGEEEEDEDDDSVEGFEYYRGESDDDDVDSDDSMEPPAGLFQG
jgi:hypothetical protein